MGSASNPAELRDAYDRARPLRFLRISFADALACPLMRKQLDYAARAHRKEAQKRNDRAGNDAGALQASLFQEAA